MMWVLHGYTTGAEVIVTNHDNRIEDCYWHNV